MAQRHLAIDGARHKELVVHGVEGQRGDKVRMPACMQEGISPQHIRSMPCTLSWLHCRLACHAVTAQHSLFRRQPMKSSWLPSINKYVARSMQIKTQDDFKYATRLYRVSLQKGCHAGI